MLSRVLDPSPKENRQGRSVWMEISLGVRGFKENRQGQSVWMEISLGVRGFKGTKEERKNQWIGKSALGNYIMQNGPWVTPMSLLRRSQCYPFLWELVRKGGHFDPHSSCSGAMCGMRSPKHFSGGTVASQLWYQTFIKQINLLEKNFQNIRIKIAGWTMHSGAPQGSQNLEGRGRRISSSRPPSTTWQVWSHPGNNNTLSQENNNNKNQKENQDPSSLGYTHIQKKKKETK